MPVPDGFVKTPPAVAALPAAHVFGLTRPAERPDGGRLLLPGLGTGNLYAGVTRYCTAGEHWRLPEFDYQQPTAVGVEKDDARAATAANRFGSHLTVKTADFLLTSFADPFDWALLNPPFTRYKHIDEDRRAVYRDRFQTATGQFPLYAPFVEHALANLRPGGSLTAILPSKALTVGNAGALRSLLSDYSCGPIALLPEATFSEMVVPILLTVERQESDFEYGWWIEPILPYGPTPLLERLGIDDLSQASTTYRDRLTDMKTRLAGSPVCQSTHDTTSTQPRHADQADLDTFL